MKDRWNEVKVQKLSPIEIESMISREFGAKLNPVNADELAKKYRSDALRRSVKTTEQTE